MLGRPPQNPSLDSEPIADSRLGKDISRSARRRFYFAAKVDHVDAKVSMLLDILRAPNLGEKVAPRNYSPCVNYKRRENLVFDGREPDRLPSKAHPTCVEIDYQITGPERPRLFYSATVRNAPQRKA